MYKFKKPRTRNAFYFQSKTKGKDSENANDEVCCDRTGPSLLCVRLRINFHDALFRDWVRERAVHSCSLQPRGSAT